jgi:4-amino-4-deoxy-L-arabinose transferase-like glycosyltransferase
VVATGALLGLAFLAKMLQAFTVLPGFAVVYLMVAPTTLRRRVLQLLAGGAALVVAAGWWVAVVALWPAGSRPYIDGSTDNSIINLILGYNGLGRLSGLASGPGAQGQGGGGGFSGTPGILRLFNDLMGGQASWLLPAALIALVAGVAACGRAARSDRRRAALLLWGSWLVVTGLVFSLGKGVIHTYYTVALAPAIAALIGIGTALLWSARRRRAARLTGAAAVAATAAWSYALLDRTPSWHPWLRVLVVAAAAIAAIGLLAGELPGRRLTMAALALGLTASLAGPVAYTLSTIGTPETGGVPSAGPAVASTVGRGGPGGAGGFRPGRAAGGPGAFGGGPAGAGFAGGPPGGGVTTSAALTTALKADANRFRWVAATFGSQSAAGIELSTGEPVMAIGGFSGGGELTLAQFEAYVARGDLHYFLATRGGGPGGDRSSESAITSWVESRFKAVTLGGQTVYDLTARTS